MIYIEVELDFFKCDEALLMFLHPVVPCEKTRVVRQEMGHIIIHLLSNSLQTGWFRK